MRSGILNALLRCLTSVAMLIAATPVVRAQHAHDVEEITVTARPFGSQDAAHVSQPVDVLAGPELMEKMSGSLGETLAQQPGVTASGFGQGASRPIIRGLGGARVSVLQNGMSTMDLSTLSDDHAVPVEPMQSEQIEILRGPMTLLYGSGAVGGVVNVVNNRIPGRNTDPFHARAEIRHGTAADETAIGFLAEGRGEFIGFHADALRRHADDYEAAHTVVGNSAVKNEDYNVGISGFGELTALGAAVGRYVSEYGIPFNPDEPEEMPFIALERDQLNLSASRSDPVPGVEYVNARAAHVDYEHLEYEAPGVPGTRFTNGEWEGRLELRHVPVLGWGGTVGAQYRHRDTAALGNEAILPPTLLRSLGVFILEELDLGDWHLEFGARLEDQGIDPEGSSGRPAADHTAFSLAGGARRRMSENFDLALSFNRSERAPAPEELYVQGPHHASATYEEGDATLGKETSNNIDLGLQTSFARWNWSIGLFSNYIEDFVFAAERDENGDGVADHVDADRQPGGEFLLVGYEQQNVLFYGAETELNVELMDNDTGHLDARLWGDFVRGKLTGGGNLPRISPARIGAALEFSRGVWHADLELTGTFDQHRAAGLESDTDGYLLLQTGVSYAHDTGPGRVTWFLRGNNLLNENARRHSSLIKDRAPLPGRSITLGISAEL